MFSDQIWLWGFFNLFVLAMLALDLGVFHRKSKEVPFKEALGWSILWISLATVFGIGILYFQGAQASIEFFTGYLIEYSLSIDNIFVFLLIFTYFNVPHTYRHKVLFWGIIGALVFRAIFIAAGITLIEKFHWMIYLFGIFLILTGIKMALQKDKKIEPEKNPMLRLFRRFVPVTESYEQDRFFIKRAAQLFATPLFITLLFVEITDIIFAVDSIPAILAITRDPFIVYTSNVFAILGLRSLYFALAGFMKLFHHLHYGLAFILVFVGCKLALVDIFKIPTLASLGVILAVLLLSILALA
jgi:tellurite resistance protein TerC